jgi:protease prsW family protein
MECPTCHSPNPDAAIFCGSCGHALRSDAGGRRSSYAVQSSENVASLALISTIMPHTTRTSGDAYRWFFLVTGLAVAGLTLTGLLPAALLAGAFLMPLAYLLYLREVNLWEDTPGPVIGAVFVLTGILSAGVSLLFFHGPFEGAFRLLATTANSRGGDASLPLGPLLIFAGLLPLVGEVIRNAGPLVLASRARFDDLIDGLTLGVAAGTAYAAVESLVQFWPVFTSGELRTTDGLATWLFVILNLAVVKSLIYGTATGLAVAAYSGLGKGHDGVTRRYVLTFASAVLANAAYWLGVHALARAPMGAALGLLWGLVVLAVLVLRVRSVLHRALLEAALEDTAGRGAEDGAWCAECEMPLVPGARFCVACGTSVRPGAHLRKRGGSAA